MVSGLAIIPVRYYEYQNTRQARRGKASSSKYSSEIEFASGCISWLVSCHFSVPFLCNVAPSCILLWLGCIWPTPLTHEMSLERKSASNDVKQNRHVHRCGSFRADESFSRERDKDGSRDIRYLCGRISGKSCVFKCQKTNLETKWTRERFANSNRKNKTNFQLNWEKQNYFSFIRKVVNSAMGMFNLEVTDNCCFKCLNVRDVCSIDSIWLAGRKCSQVG